MVSRPSTWQGKISWAQSSTFEYLRIPRNSRRRLRGTQAPKIGVVSMSEDKLFARHKPRAYRLVTTLRAIFRLCKEV
jgi:hypothetical protein